MWIKRRPLNKTFSRCSDLCVRNRFSNLKRNNSRWSWRRGRSSGRRLINSASIRRRIFFGSRCYEKFLSVSLTHKYVRACQGRRLILDNHLSLLRWKRIGQNDRSGWISLNKMSNVSTTWKIFSINCLLENEARIFRISLLCILSRLSFGFLLLQGIFLNFSFTLFLTSRLLRFIGRCELNYINLRSFTRSSSEIGSVLNSSSRSALGLDWLEVLLADSWVTKPTTMSTTWDSVEGGVVGLVDGWGACGIKSYNVPYCE